MALTGCAPYPASVTALMIFSADAVPETIIELVKRLTAHSVTPSTAFTAFSTRATQAAQLIPVISYLFLLAMTNKIMNFNLKGKFNFNIEIILTRMKSSSILKGEGLH